MTNDGFAERLSRWTAPRAEWLLLFLVFSGPPTFRRRDPTASLRGELDLAVAFQIGVWVVAGLWIALNFLKRERTGQQMTLAFPRIPVSTLLGCLLSVLLAVSCLGSTYPPLTLFRAYQTLIGCLLGFLLVDKLGIVGSLRFFRRGLAFLGWLAFVVFAVAPDLVLLQEQYFGIRGDTVTPTHVAGVLLFVLVFAWPFPEGHSGTPGKGRPCTISRTIWIRHRGLPARVLGLLDSRAALTLLVLALVVLSRSRLALALFIAVTGVVAVTAGRRWTLWGQLGFPVVVAITVLASIAAADFVVAWVVRNPAQLSNMSLRLPLWQYLLSKSMEESPVLGLGYVAAARVLGPQVAPPLANAHSSFLEILVGGGVISLGVYLALWALVLYRLGVAALSGERLGVALLMLSLVLLGFATTTSHPILPSPPSLVFWAMVAVASSPGILRREVAGSREAGSFAPVRRFHQSPLTTEERQ